MKKNALIILLALPCFVFCQNNKEDQLLDSFDNCNNSKDQLEACNEVASYYYDSLQDVQKAIPYYLLSSKLAKELFDAEESANAINYVGICYEMLGMHDSALICFDEYLEIGIKLSDNEIITNAYKNKGIVFEFSGKYEDAILNYIEAARVCDEMNDTVRVIDSYINIGSIYRSINQPDKAMSFFDKALELILVFEDDVQAARLYNQLAIVEKGQGNYQLALEHYYLSLDYSEKADWDKGVATAYSNIGNVYIDYEDYETALDYHLKALEIEEEIEHFYGIRISKNVIGSIYLYLGQLDNAELFCSESCEMAKKENNFNGLNECYRNLVEINVKKGEPDVAIKYFDLYRQSADTIFSLESIAKISEIETIYQTEKKDHQIEILNIKNTYEKAENKKKSKFILVLSIVLSIVLIMVVVILIIYLQKQKAYKTLVKMNVLAVKCEQKNETLEKDQKKTLNSDLSHLNDLAEKLTNYFISEKPYLDFNFNIDKLSKDIDSNRQYVSKTINEVFGKNFSTYVNEYRVKEARKLLLDSKNDKYTMESIAESSGFNNRTSFIAAFKKYTGVTPSYFKANSSNLS